MDRERVGKALANTNDFFSVNAKRRDNINYSPRDFVLVHRDSQMHISNIDYEFLGPYEVLKVLGRRYELKNVGSNMITKAAKKQMRPWPTNWVVTQDMEKLIRAPVRL